MFLHILAHGARGPYNEHKHEVFVLLWNLTWSFCTPVKISGSFLCSRTVRNTETNKVLPVSSYVFWASLGLTLKKHLILGLSRARLPLDIYHPRSWNITWNHGNTVVGDITPKKSTLYVLVGGFGLKIIICTHCTFFFEISICHPAKLWLGVRLWCRNSIPEAFFLFLGPSFSRSFFRFFGDLHIRNFHDFTKIQIFSQCTLAKLQNASGMVCKWYSEFVAVISISFSTIWIFEKIFFLVWRSKMSKIFPRIWLLGNFCPFGAILSLKSARNPLNPSI